MSRHVNGISLTENKHLRSKLLFSQRYHRALKDGSVNVHLSDEVRRKSFAYLESKDHTLYVQRDPTDNWNSRSSIIEESILELMTERGWRGVPGTSGYDDQKDSWNYNSVSNHVFEELGSDVVLDYIEIYLRNADRAIAEACSVKLNQIFDQHDCPWRLIGGEFFKLDPDFVGARLTNIAHDALKDNSFEGASQEFAKARQELTQGDIKDTISHAAKSLESVMKVMTGQQNLNADQLIRKMLDQNYFDDLPADIRAGFAEQVMKTVPFIRNKLGGHGQGAQVIEVPAMYGELTLQLAAAFHNFLLSKHLERHPKTEEPPSDKTSDEDDDIPF